ncbi:TPA: hypothetical protein I7730_15685 [Vibrio vulnificus]|uniref:Uncharacterized protein n=1 Tax=Vibrio vulnificus TaxID=672 RepID=A0A8H9TG91_VIBVL|nr:hypothetical protein [Vibrio vulnificus]HAS8541223.1 hypothetical protein [Vibrio vulnificus]
MGVSWGVDHYLAINNSDITKSGTTIENRYPSSCGSINKLGNETTNSIFPSIDTFAFFKCDKDKLKLAFKEATLPIVAKELAELSVTISNLESDLFYYKEIRKLNGKQISQDVISSITKKIDSGKARVVELKKFRRATIKEYTDSEMERIAEQVREN